MSPASRAAWGTSTKRSSIELAPTAASIWLRSESLSGK
jgi:hypothetical protein